MDVKIKYTLIHKDNKARLGKIETNYGTYDTPMFMPVGTRGTVKTLDYRDLKEVNAGFIGIMVCPISFKISYPNPSDPALG